MPQSPAHMLREFHTAFDLPVRDVPVAVPPEAELRRQLIREEYWEFIEASMAGDLVGIAQELADLVYVAYGAAATHGIDLDAVIAEVHAANMRKRDADGKVHRRPVDGKVIKPPGFVPADVARALGLEMAK